MTMKEMIDKLGSMIPGAEAPGIAKCRKAVYFEKDLFLRLWKIDDLKELCKEKGILTIKQDIAMNLGGSEVVSQELDFYGIIRLLVEKVSSRELIEYAKKNKIDYTNFETKVNELMKFYKLN